MRMFSIKVKYDSYFLKENSQYPGICAAELLPNIARVWSQGTSAKQQNETLTGNLGTRAYKLHQFE